MDNPNLEGQELSPWGDEGKDPWRRGRGNYSPGGAILLWAQKLYDVEEPWRFHQDAIDRALEKVGGERSQDNFREFQEALGMKSLLELFGDDLDLESFLRSFVLMDVTDGYIDPEAAEAAGLRQSERWVGPIRRPMNVSALRRLDRDEISIADLQAAGGGHGALYIPSNEPRNEHDIWKGGAQHRGAGPRTRGPSRGSPNPASVGGRRDGRRGPVLTRARCRRASRPS